VIRRREDEHPIVAFAEAVELREELHDHVAHPRMFRLDSLTPKRIDLVEKQHARRRTPRVLEDCM
jgi:hypothetical protein